MNKICLFIVEKSEIRLVYILFVDTRGFQKCLGEEEESDKFVELSGGCQCRYLIFKYPNS
jgi:hypothetical protein